MINSERWQRLEAIFHAAIERPPEERAEFARRACDGDEALWAELEQVLIGFDESRKCTPLPAAPPETSRRGVRLGEYQIEREIAHGGMGTVYLASRADGHFEQQVALKVVSAHLRSEFFAERFLTERQILAQLNHPNVTRLLDGGVSADGDPYLVMEYVDGEPIHRYCDAHLLTVRERMGLFLDVCSAVEYAHRNLVVHRDLKPGNILVTRDGVPKLLDFGTAKLLSMAAPDATATRFGMMTPRYASPEQLRGEPVTTGADVYSLGVVLYELLTGASPFGGADSPIAELERASGNIGPARPASVITGEAARLRGDTLARLGRLLDGDLRSILAKACEPDARNRYRSVEQFSDDLRRYLVGKPVLARPQTWLYRAARFTRRNRWRLAAAGAVGAVLAFTGLSALHEFGRSQRRMVQVRNLSQSYLTDILDEVGKLPGSLTARMLIVNRARRNLDELLPDAPADGELRRALAAAYLKLGDIQGRPFTVSLGDTAGALESYRKAEALAAKAAPKDWDALAVLIRARISIGVIEARAGQVGDAVALMQSNLEPARRLLKEAPRGVTFDGMTAGALLVDANLRLGYVQMVAWGSAPTSEKMMESANQFRRTVALGEELQKTNPAGPDLAAVPSQFLGFALEGVADRSGDRKYYEQSAAAHRRALDGICKLAAAAPSPLHERNCADAYGELSWALHNAGDGASAVEAARENLRRMEPVAQAEPGSLELQNDITTGYFHLGAAEQVDRKYQDAIRDLRAAAARIPIHSIPPEDPFELAGLYANIQRDLAAALLGSGDSAGALKALEDGVAAAKRPEVQGSLREEMQRQLAQWHSGMPHESGQAAR